MSTNINVWNQDDFSKGENDLMPAHTLGKNEVVKLTNLIPGKDGQPLKTRGGTAVYRDFSDTISMPVDSMYRFSRTVGTPQGAREFDLFATKNAVYRVDGDSAIKMFDWPTPGNSTSFSTLNNTVFAANGTDVIRAWDGDTSKEFAEVKDRDNTGPRLRCITSFRGRLWGVDGGVVWFCGSDDASEETSASKVARTANPNLDPVYYKRWENWGGTLDSDGGFLAVGDDDGQSIQAVGSLYNGVLVFKDKTVYLWAYSEDAHPVDVLSSSVEVLVPGVGCASHGTIQYAEGAIIFLGQNDVGEYAIYRLSGSGIDDVSVKIPLALSRVVATSSSEPRSALFGSNYFLAADDRQSPGSARTMVYALDLKRGCWYEIAGWNVGGFSYSKSRERLFIGDATTAKILEYPHGSTDSGEPIRYELKTKVLHGSSPLEDTRWLKVWLDLVAARQSVTVGTSFDGGTESGATRTFESAELDYWDKPDEPDFFDGSMWEDRSFWYDADTEQHIVISLPKRSKTMQVSVRGSTDEAVSIRRVAVGMRARKLRY